VAVGESGADPQHNARLRLAIQKARDNNMPLENIERAVKRASAMEETALTEAVLEGYGPGGVAILLYVLTDNRNRAIQEIRSLFTRSNGSLGEAGCVSWLFQQKGMITIDTKDIDAEEAALRAIDAGAEDVKIEKGYLEVYAFPENLEAIREKLEGYPIASAEIAMLPSTTVSLDEKEALSALKLIDRLDELDEVQRVFSNIDFSEEVLEKYKSS
jgi:YebC/PmpR family DNA-binding regulatory protein